MVENEILKKDVIDEKYFLKVDEIIKEMFIDGNLRVVNVVLDKELTFDEKFNYLKSQMLKEPIKSGVMKDFLYNLKNYVVITQLEVLSEKGFAVAKDLYVALAGDVEIENKNKRLFEG